MIEIDPNSSILLDYICNHHIHTLEHLNPNSECFKRIQAHFNDDVSFLESALHKDQHVVDLVTMLILASMVFSDQSFESVCAGCRIEGSTLHIVWKNNIKSSIKVNLPAHQLKQFLTEAQRHLYPGVKAPKLSDIMIACHNQYKLNETTFNETNDLLRTTLAVLNTGQKPTIDQLFLMICSAPNDILTKTYTELSQLINDEDTIETALQNTITIKDIFQSNSPNVNLNFEKIKTHFNLCFYHTDQSYRDTISQKTIDTTWPILNQQRVKTDIKETLTQTSTQLIQTYTQFFHSLATYTEPLIHPKNLV